MFSIQLQDDNKKPKNNKKSILGRAGFYKETVLLFKYRYNIQIYIIVTNTRKINQNVRNKIPMEYCVECSFGYVYVLNSGFGNVTRNLTLLFEIILI